MIQSYIFYGEGDIMAVHKKQRVMIGICSVLFVLYTLATFFADEVVFDFISPALTLSIFLLIAISLPYTNWYKSACLMIALGVFFWFLGDIFWTIYYNLIEDTLFLDISSQFYLLPLLMFALAVLVYLKRGFRATVFARFTINSFMLTALFLIIMYKLGFDRYVSFESFDLNMIDLIFNLWLVGFSLCGMFSVLSSSGVKGHTRAGIMVASSMIVYNLLELWQISREIRGLENESIYADIVYVFCLFVMGIALTDSKIEGREFIKNVKVKNIGDAVKIMWLNMTLVVGVSLFALGFKKITFTEFLIIAMITLVYVVMYKNVQTTELVNELLEKQLDENARLEKLVEEKTKELKGVNHYLEMVSNTDELTGLHNRRYGMSFVDNLTRDDLNYPFALYSIDLNFFKPINDNYGHDMGDLVLKEVANRLKRISFERCTPFRIGGDEFVVVYNAFKDRNKVESVAQEICELLDEPISCVDKRDYLENTHHTFHISACVGVAVYPEDTSDIDVLFVYADKAMYAIKHKYEKSAYKFYNELTDE